MFLSALLEGLPGQRHFENLPVRPPNVEFLLEFGVYIVVPADIIT